MSSTKKISKKYQKKTQAQKDLAGAAPQVPQAVLFFLLHYPPPPLLRPKQGLRPLYSQAVPKKIPTLSRPATTPISRWA